jgi:hypothetical protein
MANDFEEVSGQKVHIKRTRSFGKGRTGATMRGRLRSLLRVDNQTPLAEIVQEIEDVNPSIYGSLIKWPTPSVNRTSGKQLCAHLFAIFEDAIPDVLSACREMFHSIIDYTLNRLL